MSPVEFDSFSRQIARIQEHAELILKQAQAYASERSHPLLLSVLQELSTAIEELIVTEETLELQHEQLISVHELLEIERQRYRELFDYAPDAYLITDMDGAIQQANTAAATMLNIRSEYLTGKPLGIYINDLERKNFSSFLLHLRDTYQGAPYHWEAKLLPRNQPPIYVSLRITLGFDVAGKPATIRWLIRDVTRYKEIEEEIRQLNNNLEERVQERTELLKIEQELKDDALSRERKARIEAEVLRDISRMLTSSVELDEVLEDILANVGRVVAHDAADIMLIEDQTILLALCRGYNYCDEKHHILNLHFSLQETFPVNMIYKTGEALLLARMERIPDWIARIDPDARMVSYVGVPIWARGEVIGFLNLNSKKENFFTGEHIDLLQIFSSHAAAAIQNARLYQHTRSLAVMEERQRLARELHDAVSQSLFSSSLLTEALPQLVEDSDEELKSHLEYLHRLNRGALAEMRTLLLELHPTHLLETEIKTLLEHLVKAVKGRKEMEMEVEIVDGVPLPVEVKIGLYRIAQEGLHNVVKHSGATWAKLSFIADDEFITLRVDDNGAGFNVNEVNTGMGLNNIRERAKSIGANCEIRTAIGHGTALTVRWPRHP